MGEGQQEDPKHGAGIPLPGAAFFPLNFLPKSNVATGSTRPRGEALPAPGHLSQKPNYQLSRAVSSLTESPWGEGTAEIVKYSEGNTFIPSQKQNMASRFSPLPFAWGVTPNGRSPHGASSLNPTTSLHPHCRRPVHQPSPPPGPWHMSPLAARGTCSNHRS